MESITVVVWRCAMVEYGAPSVMTPGISLMPLLPVDSSTSQQVCETLKQLQR